MTRTPTASVACAAFAALLLLAGCAGAPSTPEEACRAEARAAPEVVDAGRRQPPPNTAAFAQYRDEIARAERAAYLRCARARGLTSPGVGVEPVRRF